MTKWTHAFPKLSARLWQRCYRNCEKMSDSQNVPNFTWIGATSRPCEAKMQIFGLRVNLIPAVCRKAAILPVITAITLLLKLYFCDSLIISKSFKPFSRDNWVADQRRVCGHALFLQWRRSADGTDWQQVWFKFFQTMCPVSWDSNVLIFASLLFIIS